jgi:hypothetical protein
MVTCEILDYAGFVSGNWPPKAQFPVSERRAGNKIEFRIKNYELRIGMRDKE